MTTRLCETEAGRRFIKVAVAAAADAALGFAGEPDVRVRQHLEQFRLKIITDLADEVGRVDAERIADGIITMTMARKHEIERVPHGRA